MSPEYEKRLEAEIHRELTGLPEIQAPASLVPRTLRAILQHACVPWYRQSWPAWPVPVRVVSLSVLLGLFSVVCYAGWKLPQFEEVSTLTEAVGGWISGAAVLWKALHLLVNGLASGIRQLGTGFLVACFAALGLGYAACVALTACYIRLGLARKGIYESAKS